LARAIAVRSRRSDSGVSPAKAPARAKATLDNHQANIRVLRSLPQTYNFKMLVFWQPSLASGYKPALPNPESGELRSCTTLAAGRRFYFPGHVFESVQEPVYIDRLMHLHLGPRGAELSCVRSLSRSKTIRRNRHQTKRTVWGAQ
jgi:hypothetical protein